MALRGAFDIDLPLTGPPGIECRSGGPSRDYKLVLTFSTAVTVSGAAVSSGIGTVTSATATGSSVAVNLTGVSNAQRISIKVYGISDNINIGEITVPMHVLAGDVSGDGVVNSADVTLVRRESGQLATVSNFRNDLSTDGVINSADVTLVRRESGIALPSTPLPGPQVDVTYGHDADGKVIHLFAPPTDYDFRFGYDPMGRFERIYQGADPGIFYQYFYDKSSNVLERRNNLNSTKQVYVPDELNRIKERVITAISYDSNGTGYLYDFSHERYGFDPMSRLKTVDRDEDGKRDTFVYDADGQLDEADYGWVPDGQGGFSDPARSVRYGLDAAGNRRRVIDGDQGINYTANSLNQYAQTANGPQHEIAGYAGVSYRYLADTYLASASSAAAGTYELGYDALGRTVKRTTNGQSTYFAFAGDRPIIEYNSTGAITASSVYGLGIDEIIARNNNGEAQFLHQDRLGNTSAVTNIAGEVIEQYRYDAFGKPTIRSGPTPDTGPNPANRLGTLLSASQINNRFLFTGREWVHNFGFYEYRARAYHPGLGRFMSEDPIGFAAGDHNLYRYCRNDPENRVDPMGLLYWSSGYFQALAMTQGQMERQIQVQQSSARVEFRPRGQEKAVVKYVPPQVIKATATSNTLAYSSVKGLKERDPKDPSVGVQATKNTTGGYDVVQKLKVVTVMPEGEKAAGLSSPLLQGEIKNVVNKYRDAASEADLAARNLARKGFSDPQSAADAVRESTQVIFERYYVELFGRNDL